MEKIGVELSLKGGDDFIGSLRSATKSIEDFSAAAKNIPKIDFGTPKLPDFSSIKIPNIAQDINQKVAQSGGIDLSKTPIHFPDFIKETGAALSNITGFVAKGVTEIGKIGLAAASAAGNFAVGFGKDSVAVFGDFEQVMNTTTGVMGLNEKQVGQLTDQAIELGAKYPVSTKGVAEAQQELGKAGFDANQTLAATPDVLKLAMGANIDLGKAAEYSGGTLRGFGLDVKDLTHVTDVLNSTANASSVDIGDLAQTFKYVAPAAKGAGFSFEDMSIASGLLGNNMIKGSQAGTSLRTMITRLAAPPKDAAAAIEALGLKVTDANGKMRPFNDIIKEVRSKFQGLSEVDQIDLAKKLAGQEAMSSLLALVNSSDDDWNNMSQAINNADGSTSKLVDTMNKGTKSALTNMSGSVEALQIRFGQMLAPAVNWAANALSDFINNVSTAFSEIQKGLNGTDLTGADLANPFVQFGSVLRTDILPAVSQFAQFFVSQVLPAVISVAGVIVSQVIPAVIQFGSQLFNFLYPIITGVITWITTQAIPAILNFGQFFVTQVLPKIQTFANWIGSNLGPIITSIATTMTSTVIPAVASFAKWVSDTLLPKIQDLGNFIGTNLVPVFERIGQFISDPLIPTIGKLVGVVLNDVIPTLTNWVTVIGTALAPVITAIAKTITDDIIPAISNMVKWIGENAVPAFNNITDVVNTKVMPVLTVLAQYLGGAFATAWNTLSTLIGGIWAAITTVISTAWNTISGIFNVITKVLSGDFGGAWNTLKETIGKAWDGITSLIGTAWTTISGIFGKMIDGVKNTLTPVIEALKPMFQGVFDTIGSVINTALGIWNGLIEKIQQGAKLVGDVAKGDWGAAWDDLTGKTKDSSNQMQSIANTTRDNVLSKLKEIPTGATSSMADGATAISNSKGVWGSAAYSVGTSVGQGIGKGITDYARNIANAAAAAVTEALNAAKAAAGAHSPARVFADEVGVPIGQGVALGINLSTPLVAAAGQGMVTQALPTMQQMANSTYYNSSSNTNAQTYNIYTTQGAQGAIADIEQMKVGAYAT